MGKPSPKDQLAWNGMMEAVKRGWTRAIGVDDYKPAQIENLKGAKPAVNMCSMSMKTHDDATIEYCQKNGIVYNAFEVMVNSCCCATMKPAAAARDYGLLLLTLGNVCSAARLFVRRPHGQGTRIQVQVQHGTDMCGVDAAARLHNVARNWSELDDGCAIHQRGKDPKRPKNP